MYQVQPSNEAMKPNRGRKIQMNGRLVGTRTPDLADRVGPL